MKQLIIDVLEDMSGGQINLASETAREMIATSIVSVLKVKGYYTDSEIDLESEIDQEEVRQTCVCQICGKNTYDVDWDYIGSGTNHLQCELELEFSEEIIENKTEGFIYESPDNGKTIFRRPLGDQNMKNKVEVNWETKEPTGRVFTDYPFD